ncbi:MAG: hypothetical protein PHQ04_01515 [Opitutaceae bacterium]|nr:hypothetical protein [Opitutaceae bacterium]
MPTSERIVTGQFLCALRDLVLNRIDYIHDADGNMTYGPLPSGSLAPYTYDTRNRLTNAGGSGYRCNPDGLRVEITGTGAATFVVDPNAALSRTLMRTKSGTTTYYVYGVGLLYEETGGSTSTYHFNQIGSTLALTDGSQTVTDRWSYAPYGAAVSHTGSSDTSFLFNGELGVMTDANGLQYMRARYYNPRLMRFINADPIKFDGGLNWYVFVGNNPIGRVDPLGLCAQNPATNALIQQLLTLPYEQRSQLLKQAGSAFDSWGEMQNEFTQVIFGGKLGASVSVGQVVTGDAIKVLDATVYNSGPALINYFKSPSTQQTIQQSGLVAV